MPGLIVYLFTFFAQFVLYTLGLEQRELVGSDATWKQRLSGARWHSSHSYGCRRDQK